MAQRSFIPKGAYRFRTNEDADRHELECSAIGLAQLAAQAAPGKPGDQCAPVARWVKADVMADEQLLLISSAGDQWIFDPHPHLQAQNLPFSPDCTLQDFLKSVCQLIVQKSNPPIDCGGDIDQGAE